MTTRYTPLPQPGASISCIIMLDNVWSGRHYDKLNNKDRSRLRPRYLLFLIMRKPCIKGGKNDYSDPPCVKNSEMS